MKIKYYNVLQNNIKLASVKGSSLFVWSSLLNNFNQCLYGAASYVKLPSDEICLISGHIPDPDCPYQNLREVTVTPISESEYNAQLQLESPTLPDLIPYRTKRISELSAACEEKILAGFDLKLSDNITHHFSLTTYDQLAIQQAYMKVLSGQTDIYLHADNEPYRIFSAEEIIKIYNTMKHLCEYETMYFNSLKIWIKNIQYFSELSKIEYGDPVPIEYQTEAFKQIQRALI